LSVIPICGCGQEFEGSSNKSRLDQLRLLRLLPKIPAVDRGTVFGFKKN
jgi:hypothetical protein